MIPPNHEKTLTITRDPDHERGLGLKCKKKESRSERLVRASGAPALVKKGVRESCLWEVLESSFGHGLIMTGGHEMSSRGGGHTGLNVHPLPPRHEITQDRPWKAAKNYFLGTLPGLEDIAGQLRFPKPLKRVKKNSGQRPSFSVDQVKV